MNEEKKEKPPGFDWDHLNDMLNYGLGAGSRDSVDAFRMAFQAGIIGKGPPLTPLDPLEFPVKPLASPPAKDKPSDAAEKEIEDLREKLRYRDDRIRRHQSENLQIMARAEQLERENRRLKLEAQQLAMEKMNTYGVPQIIKKYLKFLIFACHPDRNPGRAEAVEVTKALLDLRGKK